MITVHISTRFRHSFKKQPADVRVDFAKKIQIFQDHPFDPSLSTHKLSGSLSEYYAFYLRDGFRVLFDFVDSDVVLLVNIGNHDDYKKWARAS